jgi:DNA modification methylase
MRVAHSLGRNAIGIELSNEYCLLTASELALSAIKNLKSGAVYESS